MEVRRRALERYLGEVTGIQRYGTNLEEVWEFLQVFEYLPNVRAQRQAGGNNNNTNTNRSSAHLAGGGGGGSGATEGAMSAAVAAAADEGWGDGDEEDAEEEPYLDASDPASKARGACAVQLHEMALSDPQGFQRLKAVRPVGNGGKGMVCLSAARGQALAS